MTVCARRVVLPNGVTLLHLFFGLLLVAEYFYNLLPVYHLFNVAVEVGYGFLLSNEICAALADNLLDELHDNDKRQADDNSQSDADIEHTAEHGGDGKRGRDKLTHRLREHLAQGVGVVRIEAHRVAVGVRVEISYRQTLHLFKHLVAYGFQRALGNRYHAAVIDER